MTNYRSRALPSGGSAVLNAWRQQHGPETVARRQAAYAGAAGQWMAAPSGRLHNLPGNTSPRQASGLRGYMAASNDRLVDDMLASVGLQSGNAEVRMALSTMRRKSRQLANDNEYVKRFLQLLRDQVVGPRGFELQMKVKKTRGGGQDKDANTTIEEAYARYSKLGSYTPCGKYSRAAFERAAIQRLAVDGELIIEELIGRQFGPFGMASRLIDPDMLDDQLNLGRNGAVPGVGRLPDGHDIRMGVERNAYGRPVAYWFLTAHPGDDVSGHALGRHRRVLAERIRHIYLVEELRPDTARGVPWIFAALRRMAMLGGYEEAALVGAREGAAKMGFYKQPSAEGMPINPGRPGDADGTGVADGEDPEGNLVQVTEPGQFNVLPPGWDFQAYDPAYPNDAMAPFVKGMLRAFAAGVGFNYNTISGDLEGVSLSSLRQGGISDRATIEALQAFFIENISQPGFERWLRLGLDLGQIGRLPMDGFDRFNHSRFIARPWRSPDPQKDVAAGAQRVALGTASRTRLCAENGEDFEEILNELATEQRMARELGVTLSTEAASAHKTPAVNNAGKPTKPGAEGAATAGEADPDDDEPQQGADDDEPAAE